MAISKKIQANIKKLQKKLPFFGVVSRRRLELPRLATYAPQAYLYTIPTPGQVYFSASAKTNTRVIRCKNDNYFSIIVQ